MAQVGRLVFLGGVWLSASAILADRNAVDGAIVSTVPQNFQLVAGKLFDSLVDSVKESLPSFGSSARASAVCPEGLVDRAIASALNCRIRAPNESDALLELFPYVLEDTEAMELWKAHFLRHLASHSSSETFSAVPVDESVLQIAGEAEFWYSLPAVSHAAKQHIDQKMRELAANSKSGGASGEGPPPHVQWETQVPKHFRYQSLKDAKQLMGTFLSGNSNHLFMTNGRFSEGPPLPAKEFGDFEPVALEHFDARLHFAACESVIGHVRDQGSCGSCWAFAATETLNDRVCIASGGKALEFLSPQHTTSCCDALHCLSFGCEGGQPRMAWRWFTRSGVVTGGDYDELSKGLSCWPYEVPFCNHHSDDKRYPDCDSLPMHRTPSCRHECEEKQYTERVHPFADDLRKAATSYSVTGVERIKRELVDFGPMSSAFMVYADFLLYKSGVYQHVTGPALGGHAVKVIGFGNQDGKNFWHATNSWNVDWGDNGHFKIKMGEAGIDNEFCAGQVLPPKIAAAGDETKQPEFTQVATTVDAARMPFVDAMNGMDL